MPLNVNEFTSAIQNLEGPLSPARFEVSVYTPTFGERNRIFQATDEASRTRYVSFSAFSVNVPGTAFDIDTVFYRGYGRMSEIPTRPIYGNCTIKFYLTENMETYRFLVGWINSVINIDGDTAAGGRIAGAYYNEVNYPDNYYRNVAISTYSQTGDLILETELLDCYPQELRGIDLDWGLTDTVATSEISLFFNHIRHYRVRGGLRESFIPDSVRQF